MFNWIKRLIASTEPLPVAEEKSPATYDVYLNGKRDQWGRIRVTDAPDPDTDYVRFVEFVREAFLQMCAGTLVEIFREEDNTQTDDLERRNPLIEFRVGNVIRYGYRFNDDPVVEDIVVPRDTPLHLVAQLAGAKTGEQVHLLDRGTGVWRSFPFEGPV